MGVLDRYKVLEPVHRIEKQDIVIQKDEPVILEVKLPNDMKMISRANAVPGVKDYLIHDISQYRREDTSILLLPRANILIDFLFMPNVKDLRLDGIKL